MTGFAMVSVPDGAGGFRHERRALSDLPAPRRRGRGRIVPDPIKTGGDSTAEQLRQYLERAERIQAEIAEMQDDLADVLSEAKSVGFDPAAMRVIMARRKREKHVLDEADAILETYMIALGMR